MKSIAICFTLIITINAVYCCSIDSMFVPEFGYVGDTIRTFARASGVGCGADEIFDGPYYVWYWGDGSSDLAWPCHVYTAPGTYTVRYRINYVCRYERPPEPPGFYEASCSQERTINIVDRDAFFIYQGWNLVSTPSLEPRYMGEYGSALYNYDPLSGIYIDEDTLHPGKGYFDLSTAPRTIILSIGLTDYTDTLYPGWNLIGSIDDFISAESIETSPFGLGIYPVYGWNGFEYYESDSLYPGNGYWFLSRDHGRITVRP